VTQCDEATAKAMPEGVPFGDPTASQATRGRARAREAQASTDSDSGRRLNTPAWAKDLVSKTTRKALFHSEPVPLGDLWRRYLDLASDMDGLVPKVGVWAGGAISVAVSALAYAVAYLAQAAFLDGMNTLEDLSAAITDAGRDRTNGARNAIHAAGVACWMATAAAYAIAYVAQFPFLALALASCTGVTYLTAIT
jgi:hypothetical protein